MAQGYCQSLRRPFWLQVTCQFDYITLPSAQPFNKLFPSTLDEPSNKLGGFRNDKDTVLSLKKLWNLVKSRKVSNDITLGVTQEGHPTQPCVIREGFWEEITSKLGP